MIDKKKFYEYWKPKPEWDGKKYFMPKVFDTNFRMNVIDNIFINVSWYADYVRKIFGKFSVQLVDLSKIGVKQYICKDQIFDLWEQGIKSDYQLYKWLDKWCEKEITDYINRGRIGLYEIKEMTEVEE